VGRGGPGIPEVPVSIVLLVSLAIHLAVENRSDSQIPFFGSVWRLGKFYHFKNGIFLTHFPEPDVSYVILLD
jgi:hypothetical protein